MHIRDIFAADGTTFSFEFFPPKTEQDAEVLFQNIRQLEALRPSFVSVTYGAGGSTRQLTHDLVVRLKNTTSADHCRTRCAWATASGVPPRTPSG